MTSATPEPSPAPPAPSSDGGHVPVLPHEVLHYLAPRGGQIILDATVGRGGHAGLIMPLLGPTGRYIALDADPGNLAHARERLAGQACPGDWYHANFTQARRVLDDCHIPRVDGLLADLGFASTQVDDPQRGFSFTRDGPLDMRLDPTQATTAADLVNQLPQRELADLIYQLGEERLSRHIAQKIVENRRHAPIKSTAELADLVRRVYGGRYGKSRMDPATRTFMALRIAVNGELEALRHLLQLVPQLLKPGATAVFISFHSLEDRLVKQAVQEWRRQEMVRPLTKKPVTAGADEQRDNPRSRSAKLRAWTWMGPPVDATSPDRKGASSRQDRHTGMTDRSR